MEIEILSKDVIFLVSVGVLDGSVRSSYDMTDFSFLFLVRFCLGSGMLLFYFLPFLFYFTFLVRTESMLK